MTCYRGVGRAHKTMYPCLITHLLICDVNHDIIGANYVCYICHRIIIGVAEGIFADVDVVSIDDFCVWKQSSVK